MEIYDFGKYKDFVQSWIAAQPRKGHGQLAKMATHLSVNSSLMSQVFSGDRDLTEEQAYALGEFLALNKRESYYFVLLVQRDRAGHAKLRKLLDEQIKTLREESKFLKNRIQPEKHLTFEQQAVYYTNWLLTAIHTLTSIEGMDSVHALSEHLGVAPLTVKAAVDRLLDYGLCIEEGGRLKIGPKSTFIAGDSPLVARHHSNWRVKAMQTMTDYNERNFFYTNALSISTDDAATIRKQLVKFIEQLGTRIDVTPTVDEAFCLNIDFFKF